MRRRYDLCVSREHIFINLLRSFADHPAARGLADDAALLKVRDASLVLTHDMIVEAVHYLPDDPAEDVAWKLAAVNLSDLAAKGARPLGVLLGYSLGRDSGWDEAFAEGLRSVLEQHEVPLLGGDTVKVPDGTPRAHGMTAIGAAHPAGTPSRAGAQPGDIAYVTGCIGAAGLGLAIARGERAGPDEWLRAYRRPEPRLAEGARLVPMVHAMADISDGLLIDAMRMAEASGISVRIDLDAIPLAVAAPDDRAARLAAATAGDDYELLFAAPAGLSLSQPGLAKVTAIGRFGRGQGLRLIDAAGDVPLPPSLGYEHDTP